MLSSFFLPFLQRMPSSDEEFTTRSGSKIRMLIKSVAAGKKAGDSPDSRFMTSDTVRQRAFTLHCTRTDCVIRRRIRLSSAHSLGVVVVLLSCVQCFWNISLPAYSSLAVMKRMLSIVLSISSGMDGDQMMERDVQEDFDENQRASERQEEELRRASGVGREPRRQLEEDEEQDEPEEDEERDDSGSEDGGEAAGGDVTGSDDDASLADDQDIGVEDDDAADLDVNDEEDGGDPLADELDALAARQRRGTRGQRKRGNGSCMVNRATKRINIDCACISSNRIHFCCCFISTSEVLTSWPRPVILHAGKR